MIAPEGSLVFHEKAWNAYPYCRTIVTVHGLDPNTWKTVEIVHIDIADRSQVEPADKSRQCLRVAKAAVCFATLQALSVVLECYYALLNASKIKDYKADEDPALFHSVKTKRGPLGPNWKSFAVPPPLTRPQDEPVRLKELANTPDCPKMCAYKLVTIKFKWWGLQSKVENFIQKLRSQGQSPKPEASESISRMAQTAEL
ncbi:hypothetical protein A6R68_14329, partial [Neotoma lepida]